MKEAHQWNPAHWSDEKVRRYVSRVWRVAGRELCNILGTHQGNMAEAALRAWLAGEKSNAELARLGVPTLGDTPASR